MPRIKATRFAVAKRPGIHRQGRPTVWNHLPLGQLHQTTNYGCAGGVCTGRYANVYHLQAQRKIEQIEQKINDLREDDPSGYYDGDLDDLLDAHRALSERLRGPLA